MQNRSRNPQQEAPDCLQPGKDADGDRQALRQDNGELGPLQTGGVDAVVSREGPGATIG